MSSEDWPGKGGLHDDTWEHGPEIEMAEMHEKRIAALRAENGRLDAERTLLAAQNKRMRTLVRQVVEQEPRAYSSFADEDVCTFCDAKLRLNEGHAWNCWITRARAELAGANEPSQPAGAGGPA